MMVTNTIVMQCISDSNSVVDYKVLLGELQLSFVCLLMAQNFSGFNQWKKLVHLLCSCSDLMTQKPELFIEFMGKMENPENKRIIANTSGCHRCVAISAG